METFTNYADIPERHLCSQAQSLEFKVFRKLLYSAVIEEFSKTANIHIKGIFKAAGLNSISLISSSLKQKPIKGTGT
jgi:hypothetical protein